PTASPRSCALPDTGFVVLRDAEGSHAVLDAGAHGYMNAGHAHADALAVNLTLKGRPLLVDRGTSTYVMDRALRDRLRSSSSHNTLTIDGIPPSSPAGPFHWHTRTDATLRAVAINPAFDWAEAEHPGYTPLVHRRQILRAAD